MGFVPAPLPLTEEQWKKSNGQDIELERWLRYANGFGPIVWLWDWFRKKLI